MCPELRGWDIYAATLPDGRIIVGLSDAGVRMLRDQTPLQIAETPVVLVYGETGTELEQRLAAAGADVSETL